MFMGGGRAQCCHCVVDIKLRQRNHVHITLDHEDTFQLAYRTACFKQAVQLLTFMKHR